MVYNICKRIPAKHLQLWSSRCRKLSQHDGTIQHGEDYATRTQRNTTRIHKKAYHTPRRRNHWLYEHKKERQRGHSYCKYTYGWQYFHIHVANKEKITTGVYQNGNHDIVETRLHRVSLPAITHKYLCINIYD